MDVYKRMEICACGVPRVQNDCIVRRDGVIYCNKLCQHRHLTDDETHAYQHYYGQREAIGGNGV